MTATVVMAIFAAFWVGGVGLREDASLRVAAASAGFAFFWAFVLLVAFWKLSDWWTARH